LISISDYLLISANPPHLASSVTSSSDSIVCILLMIFLFIYEYNKYINITIASDILVDDEKKDDLTVLASTDEPIF
jgi:Endoplasmic Reticulum-Golgi Intermediate Compartment (ERGIC)